MEEKSLYENAKQRAFRLLAVRARSEKELQNGLRQRGYEKSVVRDVTARLRELKYLDDESFARGWARNLAVNRLLGNGRIESSLREKGISRELIEQVINELREEFSEKQALMMLLRKKAKNGAAGMDYKDKRKLARNLMGKGFPADLIFTTLRTTKEEFVDERE